MSDSVDPQLFQVLRRQARQDRIVNRVLAECRLILFEAEAPQPTPDVHSGVLNSAGAQSSFSRNNESRALFFAPTAVGLGRSLIPGFCVKLSVSILSGSRDLIGVGSS